MSTSQLSAPSAAESQPRSAAREGGTPGGADSGSGPRRRTRRVSAAPYLFLVPFFSLFGLFMAYPIVNAISTAFRDATLTGAKGWTGFDNFTSIAADPLFQAAAINTAFFVAVSLGVIFPVSLLLALAVRPAWIIGGPVVRILLITAAVVVPVVSAIVFQIILGQAGLLNSTILALNPTYQPIDWLNDPTWARWGVALMFVWHWTGFTMIYFVSGLANVSRELEESASVDGANGWQTFWAVTWPQLHAIRVLVLVLIIQGSAQIFDEPRIIAGWMGAGPENSLITMTMYVYEKAFGEANSGEANAAALLLLTAIVVGIGLVLLTGRDPALPKREKRSR